MAHYTALQDLMDLSEHGALVGAIEGVLERMSGLVTATVAREYFTEDWDVDPEAFDDGLSLSAFSSLIPGEVNGLTPDPVSVLVDIMHNVVGDHDSLFELTDMADGMIEEVAEAYGVESSGFEFMGIEFGGYLGTFAPAAGQKLPPEIAGLDSGSDEAQAAA